MGRWTRFMLASRPEPLIYTAWLFELERRLLADKVGEELFASLAAPNVALIMRILSDRPDWCDDRTTTGTESCDAALPSSLYRPLPSIPRTHSTHIASH